MPAKKLVVSTYLQYVVIGAVALLLFAFVRQLGGVLLTFLLAGVLAYVLNPLVRWLEGRGIPRVLAILGVFAALVAAILFALIVPASGQVRALIRDPQVLVDGAAALVDRIREVPYVGERVAALDHEALYEFARSNAPSAGQVYHGALGFIGGVFGAVLDLVLIVISVYLLLDRRRIALAALNAIPETVKDQAVELFYAVKGALAKYLKGQLLLCAIVGVFGWAILFLTGGRSGLLIGAVFAVPIVAVHMAGGGPGQMTLEGASPGGVSVSAIPAGNSGGPPREEWLTGERE